jgi:predicted RNase H-like nuclease
MTRQVFTGFDSAWTNGNSGAIASLVRDEGIGRLVGPDIASLSATWPADTW